jgi:hypothetical protein
MNRFTPSAARIVNVVGDVERADVPRLALLQPLRNVLDDGDERRQLRSEEE